MRDGSRKRPWRTSTPVALVVYTKTRSASILEGAVDLGLGAVEAIAVVHGAPASVPDDG